MARIFMQSQDLTAIGDALRECNVTDDKFLPSEMPEAIMDAMTQFAPKKRVIGEVISVNDAEEWKPLGLKLYGKSEQKTVPGVQLARPELEQNTKTSSVCTMTISDDVIHINVSEDVVDALPTFIFELSTHKLEVGKSYSVRLYDINNNLVGNIAGSWNTFFREGITADLTVTEDMATSNNLNKYYVQATSRTNTPAGDYYYKILICESDKLPDTWEPYVGGEASPNINYPQPVVSCGQRLATGAQLYDVSKITSSSASIDSDGWITVSIDNVEGTAIKYASAANVPVSDLIKPGTRYLAICEVKHNTLGYSEMISNNVNTNKSQFSTALGVAAGKTGIFVGVQTARDDFTDCKTMLRTVLRADAGMSGSITFRMSIIADTTVTAETFAYEPYTGGVESVYSFGVEEKLLTSNLLNPNACNRNFPFGIPGNTTFLWVETDVDLVQGKTYYTGFSINGVYGHYTHYINYDVTSSSQGLVTKVTDGVFVAKRSGKLCFRTDSENNAIIDNLFISEVYVEEFEPYTEQTISHQTPNGLPGIPLGQTIPDAIANSEIHMSGVYHDGEQYWIGDTRESGRNVQRIGNEVIDCTDSKTYFVQTTYDSEGVNIRYFAVSVNHLGHLNISKLLSNKFKYGMNYNQISFADSRLIFWNTKKDGSYGFTDKTSFIEAVKEFELYYILKDPIITDLTEEETQQYKSLMMNSPNTTIINSANAMQELTYLPLIESEVSE